MRSARRGPSAVRANAGGRGTGCAPAIAAAVAGASDSEKTPPMWSSRADVPASLDSATATTLFSCARCLFRVAENDFGIVAATYTGGTSTHLGDFARPQPRTVLVGQIPGPIRSRSSFLGSRSSSDRPLPPQTPRHVSSWRFSVTVPTREETRMTAPTGLAKKSVGTSSLFWFCVGASAPMTVLAGGILVTYANTGVIGTPLAFLILMVAIGLFVVGYVAMARYVPHAATFYAFFARGIGRVWGVAASFVALFAYNCMQIGLYGIIGA